MNNGIKKAIIYCRVSDLKQTREGSGLESQEFRCRQYAADKNYEVETVFRDEVTGGGNYAKRSGMMALLSHLSRNKKQPYVIIFDDLKRLGRDTRYYLELRDVIAGFGAAVECLNFTFDDSPEGEFHEEIIAATGKLERRQIARQTMQKTKARLEAGYHAFLAPVGYKFVKNEVHRKMIVRDEPAASVIAEMMEGFASGRFQTKHEARFFLESSPEFPKGKSGKIGNSRITAMLSNPLYAGYVGYKPWGVALRKGKHEGMVSYETFCKIQERLKGRAYAPTRKDINELFPLRGSVLCECGNALTGGQSKSHTGKYYSYYNCQNSKCRHGGKSIRKAVLEGEFEKLLQKLAPSKPLISTFSKMFKMHWDHYAVSQQARQKSLEECVLQLDQKIEKSLERILEAESSTVIKRLEKHIDQLEDSKRVVAEKIANCGRPVRPFDEMYRTSIQFLTNPRRLWAGGRLEEQKAVLKLVLTDRITYVRGEGYRTPKFSLPFRVLEGFLCQENQMVPRRGLEPPRPCEH